MYRVLKDDGVMTVMFTHREGEAWSGLAVALMRAGFTFRASWPVHTEPGEKFGKMQKGMLKVTVLLACRKRKSQKPGIWEHVRDEIREVAKTKIEEFSKLGIDGADLRVSVYGPILGKFADYYPMKTATGKEIEPTEALNLVVDVLNERFLKEANVQGADKETCAYLNLLSTFPNGLADYDEARLATVFGGLVTLDSLDVKGDAKLVQKKKGEVSLLSARERMAAGFLNPNEAKSLRYMIDLIHASVLLYERRGVQSVKDLIRQRSLDVQDGVQGSPFLSVLEAYTRYADASENESFRKDAAIAKPLLAALGSSATFTKKKGESLDHYASDS
jgi:adenine-specific DNA methylase